MRPAHRLSLAALALAAITLGGCEFLSPSPDRPGSYAPMCKTALANARAVLRNEPTPVHRLEDFTVSPGAPELVDRGPPVRVRCGYASGTVDAAIIFDAVCGDTGAPRCSRIANVQLEGRPLEPSTR